MADDRDLARSLSLLERARVLCIGDAMLDHYIYGEVERVSPEAPIPVLRVEREMKTLGGAGNVLRNLRALGAAAAFVSVVGNDEAGREIQRLLAEADGAEIHVLVQPQRLTTVKTRYVAANQQLLRADRENAAPLDPYIREDLLRLARELVTSHGVVVVSDYAKGVLNEGVALEVIRAAHEAGARVIVDPKGGDHIRYRGADLLRPDRRELGQATGMPVASEDGVIAAARALIERCGFGAVLASLDPDGLVLVEADGVSHVERSQVRGVYDVSGVGDAVVASAAAALGAGLGLTAAARLAGIA
ncbi:MAG TPA: bifunctional ADP-heptose synthase, partial [Stellaceae bacterium]|nr:bifunctional ADP-heptose synthase [Stellaceae bacterium]